MDGQNCDSNTLHCMQLHSKNSPNFAEMLPWQVSLIFECYSYYHVVLLDLDVAFIDIRKVQAANRKLQSGYVYYTVDVNGDHILSLEPCSDVMIVINCVGDVNSVSCNIDPVKTSSR